MFEVARRPRVRIKTLDRVSGCLDSILDKTRINGLHSVIHSLSQNSKQYSEHLYSLELQGAGRWRLKPWITWVGVGISGAWQEYAFILHPLLSFNTGLLLIFYGIFLKNEKKKKKLFIYKYIVHVSLGLFGTSPNVAQTLQKLTMVLTPPDFKVLAKPLKRNRY